MARRGGGAGTWLGLAVAGAAFAFLFFAERRRPLRRRVAPGPGRVARNLAVAALSAATLQIADRPFTRPTAALVRKRRWGLVPQLPLPSWARTAVAVLLLDYTLWIWHVLLHRASVPWRLLQIRAIGADERALALWQSALFLSVLFHHSNLRLPLELERALSRVLVTPRQHGIHHSDVLEEADSNWSSLLNVWDRMHGSLRLDVPQEALVIGLPTVPERAALLAPAGTLPP